jgi:O-antigen/teichoic acid export membrane protein
MPPDRDITRRKVWSGDQMSKTIVTTPQMTQQPMAGMWRGSLSARVQDARDAMRRILDGESDRSRTQRAALSAFAVRILSAAIAYLSQVVLARWMGSFEYGAFVFVWVWVLILGGVSSLGLNIAMMRFVPAYRESGDLAALRGLLLGGRLFVLATATVVAGLGLLGLWLFSAKLANHYVLPAYLALICIPVYALTDVQDGIGRARQWMGVGLIPPYVLRPILILASMIAAYKFGLPMTAPTAAGAAIVATWATAAVQVLLLQRRLREELPAGPRTYHFKYWVATALPILMITGFDLVVQNTDVVFLSIYGTASDVGIYFAGLKTMSLIAFVHYAVASACANQFTSLHARGQREELARFAQETVRWTFWPSLAGAAVILALGKPLLWMFGPEFTVAYGPMFVLALGLLVKSMVGPAEYLLNMLGQQKACGAVLVSTGALNVGLNAVLVPQYGLWGAASATATTLSVAAILYAILVRRLLGIDMTIWGAMRDTVRGHDRS